MKSSRILDKFYTKSEVVNSCYNAIKKNLKIKKTDLVVEPSAGNGAFIPIIRKISRHNIFIDIKPEHPDIHKQNFLTLKSINDAHIIGNPPFGNKASTAIKFIKHAGKLNAKSISFILPISFQKSSFKKSFPPNYHLIYKKVLPENSFVYHDVPKNIRTVFQIWVRKPYARYKPKRMQPDTWYSFAKKADCDLAVKRVGFSIGKVKKCSDDDNINTNWFIKLKTNIDINALILRLNELKFDTSKNVGAYSISKQDIIRKYNKVKI